MTSTRSYVLDDRDRRITPRISQREIDSLVRKATRAREKATAEAPEPFKTSRDSGLGPFGGLVKFFLFIGMAVGVLGGLAAVVGVTVAPIYGLY